MRKILTFTLLLFSITAFSATGWFQDYVKINVNGAGTSAPTGWYWIGSDPGYATQLNSADLGDVHSLVIDGCDMKYWSDNQDRTGGAFYYKIMSQDGNTEIIAPVETLWDQSFLGGNNYQGLKSTTIDLTLGLTNGTAYQLHFWAKSWGNNQGDNWLNNGGNNYVATFTYRYTTFNGTDNDWTNEDNWDYGIPTIFSVGIIDSDVTINSDISIKSLTINSEKSLTINTGKSLTISGNLNNSGTFTINSDGTGTGSLITNGTVSGDVTVQRYIPGWSKGLTGFHLLSSPVQNQLISTEFVNVSGSIPATVDFYYWNEPHNYWINIKNDGLTYNKGTSWENFSNADNPSFIVGKGYLVGYSTVQNKEFSGTPNTGDLVSGTGIPAITYTSGEGNGWNLIGNPYPSAIDWDLGTWSRTNLNVSVYVQNGATGNYVSWNGSTGGLTNGIIPAMQGFFVKAESEGASLTIPNLSRVLSTSNIYKNSEKSVENVLVLEINNENYNDQLYLQFLSQASQNYDNDYDAYKLFGTGDSPQIYSKSIDGKLLSINALPIETDELIIPVNVKIIHDGLHSIALNSNTMLSGVPIYLKDKKLNLIHEISTNKNYSFEGLINDQPDRFEIQFKSTGVTEKSNLSHPLTFYTPNTLNIRNLQPGTYQITVSDIAGRRVATKQVSTDGSVEMPVSLRMGVYIVEISSESARFANKIIIK